LKTLNLSKLYSLDGRARNKKYYFNGDKTINSSLIDSIIFKNAYSTEKMRKCFNDTSRIQSWLDVEAALARAQAKLSIIPVEAAQEINRKAHWENLDFKEMQEICTLGCYYTRYHGYGLYFANT
jgi:hypothetical protein